MRRSWYPDATLAHPVGKWLNLHNQGCSDHTLPLHNEKFPFHPGDGTKALTKGITSALPETYFRWSCVLWRKPAKFAFTWLCILWWDQLSVLRGNTFLTALWMLSLGFQVDCPHGSSAFPTRQLVDHSIQGCSSVLDTGQHQMLWRNMPRANYSNKEATQSWKTPPNLYQPQSDLCPACFSVLGFFFLPWTLWLV